LLKQSADDVKPYTDAWKHFYTEWKPLAQDLFNIVTKADLSNTNTVITNHEIALLRDRLSDSEITLWQNGIQDCYSPYSYLITLLLTNGQEKLIVNHIDKKTKIPVIHQQYIESDNEWKKYERMREIQVWWAHYQICRVTAGVTGSSDYGNYFREDNTIDEIYRYEFNMVAKGDSGQR